MAIQYPTKLDNQPGFDPSFHKHSDQHSDMLLAIGALETKVGCNSSGDSSSLDYIVTKNVVLASGANPFTADQSLGGNYLTNSGGEAALAMAFTDALGTLLATNLSVPVEAGASYRIDGYLIVSNSTAADGAQFDFNGGSATATTFDAALSAVGSVVAGTVVSAALNTKLSFTTTTGTDRIIVHGYLKVNAGGTLILQAATNTTVSGTMTLAAGSWIALWPTVNK